MKQMKFFVLFFLTFQTVGISYADYYDPSLQPMRKLLHLNKLQVMLYFGITKIGSIDLRELLEGAKDLTVYLNTGEPITGTSVAGHERRSARFAGHLVIINQRVINTQITSPRVDNNLATTLYFHEYLGALGYNDSNYQLSSVLALTHLAVELAIFQSRYMKSLDVWREYLEHLKFDPPNLSSALLSATEGGSSQTGGGGDLSPALFKYSLLYQLMFENDNLSVFKKDQLDMIRFILDMRIEVDWKNKWTHDGHATMQMEKKRGVLWLPQNFILESVINTRSINRPESILENLIRPKVKELEMNVPLFCRVFYGMR